MAEENFVSNHSSLTITNSPSPDNNLVFINAAAQAPLKLDVENYLSWHTQWFSLLISYNLYGYIDGTTICPPLTVKENTTEKLNPAHTLWTRQDHLLRSAILASLSPEIVPFVRRAETFRSVWEKLETTYAKPTRGRVIGLRESLQKTEKGSDSISKYMQNIKSLSDSMAIAGSPLDHDEIVFHILNGLGNDYKDFNDYLST